MPIYFQIFAGIIYIYEKNSDFTALLLFSFVLYAKKGKWKCDFPNEGCW